MRMKRVISTIIAAMQLTAFSFVLAEDGDDVQDTQSTAVQQSADEISVYVSIDGADSNDGSFEHPLKSIDKGIAVGTELKDRNKDKTISVNIREGEYYINKTIALSGNNSGTKEHPFIIRAYNNESVTLRGSSKLTTREFSQLKDEAVLAKIPAEARKYIGVYDLSKSISSSLTPFSSLDKSASGYTSLIIDDKEQTLARWPNTGFDRIGVNGVNTFSGVLGKGRAAGWKTATAAVVSGYFAVEYSYEAFRLTSVDSNGTVTLSGKPSYGIALNKRYYVKNLIEELDAPGEYFIDTAQKKLYYYPPYTISEVNMEIATLNSSMFSGKNLSYITFEGLGMKSMRENAITISDSNNIVVDNCDIENVGRFGISMTNCNDCTIKNSDICHIGASAIVISGGDRQKLTASNNLIDNNHIYDFAVLHRTYSPGVDLTGVGTTITHNLIHSSPGQAILFSGNDHKMLYNEMYDLVNEPTDAGAIYAGRNYTCRGNEIAYNYIHDIKTTADKGGSIFVAGVYLDDMLSSADVHHNVFYNCNLGVMFGGGRDNKFDNNILADCENGMFMDARGVGWAAYHTKKGGMAYNTLFSVPYTKSPWSERYPELVNILDGTLGLPMNNSIQNNVMYKCMSNMIANETKENGTVENNYETKDDNSFFNNYDGRDFGLKSGSDIAKKYSGAAEIDMSKIGLLPEMAASEKKKAEQGKIKLISPLNGATDISNLRSTFKWDKHNAADKYVVKIAEDPEMKNVIISQETKDTSVDIRFIPSGAKPYWWTVTGINQTQSMSGEYTQIGAPRLIISTKREKTDKTQLRKHIQTMNNLYNAVIEGTSAGTYKKGFKAQVKEILDKANNANESGNVLQADIEAINEQTSNLIASIKDNINFDVVNIGDMLADSSGWIYEDGYFTFGEDKSLTLTGSKGRKNHYLNCMYSQPIGDNTAIRFGYKVNVSSNYCMVGLQNEAAFLKGGYDIIIKSNAIEIQRRIGEGSVTDGIKESVLNFYISDNKWVDLEMGALKTGIGTYVYLTADDYLVASFLDTDLPNWSGESKFVFGNPSGESAECVAAVRPAKN